MRGEGQHDQVGVQAVQAVPQVGFPSRAPPLLPDVLHDLVLALPRHVGVRQDHLRVSQALPRLACLIGLQSWQAAPLAGQADFAAACN